MKNKIVIATIISTIFLLIFLYLASPSKVIQIINLKLRNPIKEAISDFNKGEKRYIGVYGDGPFTPGVEFSIRDRDSVKYYMSDTTDAIDGIIHGYLIEVSTEYAKQHNQKIYQLLVE